MAVSAATAALASRGGSGGGFFSLTYAVAYRRTTASIGSSATFLSPLFARCYTLCPALLLHCSPHPPQARKMCRQLSCLPPRSLSQDVAPPLMANEEAVPVPTVANTAAAPSDLVREAAALLDIRVGRVLRAWRHPEADSLYVEEVDVGEAEPRTICSGLVAYVPLEVLEGARVVVLANLKPRNMRGVKSNGMLLAASDAAHETVELLEAPEGCIPGERVWFGAADHKKEPLEPATPNQVQKKKIWESVQPQLRTDENFVAVLGELPMQTSAGSVVCRSLKNARVS